MIDVARGLVQPLDVALEISRGAAYGRGMPPFDPIASPTVRFAPRAGLRLPRPDGDGAPEARHIFRAHRAPAQYPGDPLRRRGLGRFRLLRGHYYWLVDTFSALRVGEYKWMLSSTSDDAADVHGAGGFTGITQRYTYPRLFNLYLDPKESRSYLTRKLAYVEVLREGMRAHLATFQAYPPKRVMGLRAPAPGAPPPA